MVGRTAAAAPSRAWVTVEPGSALQEPPTPILQRGAFVIAEAANPTGPLQRFCLCDFLTSDLSRLRQRFLNLQKHPLATTVLAQNFLQGLPSADANRVLFAISAISHLVELFTCSSCKHSFYSFVLSTFKAKYF